jgi:hypothetical protein
MEIFQFQAEKNKACLLLRGVPRLGKQAVQPGLPTRTSFPTTQRAPLSTAGTSINGCTLAANSFLRLAALFKSAALSYFLENPARPGRAGAPSGIENLDY